MSGAPPHLTVTHHLTADQIRAVESLVHDATIADGVPPLREDVLLQVRAGGGGLSISASEDVGALSPALLGFAHIDDNEGPDGPAVEIVVHPEARGRGVGTALLDEALSHCPPAPSPVQLWAHGQDAAAGQLARARGFTRVRHLHQLRRSLVTPLPPVMLPVGVTLLPFDPGRDVPALQALNAAAFTALPDQGGWAQSDIRARMAEEWFDPAGLLLAQYDGRLAGFHWTKIAGGTLPDLDETTRLQAAQGPSMRSRGDLGEVYVLGVHPDFRGAGLGRALTLAGLHHLRDAGVTKALLYVDATNVSAIALYTSLGFSLWDSDMLFRR